MDHIVFRAKGIATAKGWRDFRLMPVSYVLPINADGTITEFVMPIAEPFILFSIHGLTGNMPASADTNSLGFPGNGLPMPAFLIERKITISNPLATPNIRATIMGYLIQPMECE